MCLNVSCLCSFFFTESYNIILATVIPTYAGKSDHSHALNLTLANTEVVTYHILFYWDRKSTSHHLFGVVWKSQSIYSDRNTFPSSNFSLIYFLFVSQLWRKLTPLYKIPHFFFTVMVFNKGTFWKREVMTMQVVWIW